jgi:cell wall-associated NlpC family hydrolase
VQQNSADFSDLIGKPYAGCWELIVDVYLERYGIHLPAREEAVSNISMWRPVTLGDQQFGDVLVFREPHGKHVGLCIDQQFMLHTTRNKHNTIERYTGTLWKHRLQSIYRHKILR